MIWKRLADYYSEAQNKLLTACIECGRCVDECRMMKRIPNAPEATEILFGIKDFLRGGPLSPAAALKTNACMGCYGCVNSKCPIGLDSLCINQLVYRAAGLAEEKPFSKPLYQNHRQQLRERATAEERARITTPVHIPDAKYAFFPGCNISQQPELVLNALDILDAVGIPYSFIPGMEYCCGLARGNEGDADWLQDAATRLIEKASDLGAETLILWCPTCLCNIKYRVEKCTGKLPFETVSFGKYIAQNLNRLSFPGAKLQTVTLHEPCKTAYMDIDLEDVRTVLHAIPGTNVIEMKHHHKDTMCCGCRTVMTMPELGRQITDERLDEALVTGADKMLDVCHACHMFFRQHQERSGRNDIEVENYSAYITSALGLCRKNGTK